MKRFRSVYYPLSVWEKRGYDPQAFINNKAACYHDAIVGMVYCLWMTEEHYEAVDRMAWKGLAELRERKGKRAAIDDEQNEGRPRKQPRAAIENEVPVASVLPIEDEKATKEAKQAAAKEAKREAAAAAKLEKTQAEVERKREAAAAREEAKKLKIDETASAKEALNEIARQAK